MSALSIHSNPSIKNQWAQVPEDVLGNVFEFLEGRDVSNRESTPAAVCKLWAQVMMNDRLQDVFLERFINKSFGPKFWGEYYGDVGEVPAISRKTLRDTLKSPCPFYPGEIVARTHRFFLVPETVNGEPLNLNSFFNFIQTPRKGWKTKYSSYHPYIKTELGEKVSKSYWALITKKPLKGSDNKTCEQQKALIERHAQRSGIPYEWPKTLEASIVVSMEYVSTGHSSYPEETRIASTRTRCQEFVNGNKHPVSVGRLHPNNGFDIGISDLEVYDKDDGLGITAIVRNFNASEALMQKGPGERKFLITLKPSDAHKAEVISRDPRFRIAKTEKPNQFLVVCIEDLVGELQKIVKG